MQKNAHLVRFTVLVGLATVLWAASAQADDPTPRLAPIHTTPAGQTYGRWAAEWWQWALGIPGAVSPLTDTTGAQCAQRQVDAVWFLAGSVSPDPVVRTCEVPAGRSLFFPLISTFFGASLNDPPDTRTEAFVRAAGSCTEPAQIAVRIDDVQVPQPTRFFTGASGSPSPIFNVQLPPGNVFGVDDTVVPELGDENETCKIPDRPPLTHCKCRGESQVFRNGLWHLIEAQLVVAEAVNVLGLVW
jgi:hypothetical protein